MWILKGLNMLIKSIKSVLGIAHETFLEMVIIFQTCATSGTEISSLI